MQATLKPTPAIRSSRSALRGAALQQQSRSSRMVLDALVTARTVASTTKKTTAGTGKKAVAGTAKKAVPGTTSKKVGTVLVKKPGTTVSGTKTMKGTQSVGTTKKVAGTTKLKVIEVFSSDKQVRNKQFDAKPAPKILSRVEQLRLLSKAEQAGLLTLAEKSGLTLSAIEKSGLLSKAESLGLISAAADRNTPSALYALATLLLAGGPAAVYFLPDDSPALIGLQVAIALVAVAGGSAAWGGASLLSSLQK